MQFSFFFRSFYTLNISRFLVALMALMILGQGVRADTLTVGVVPQFSTKKLHQVWKPILKHLEEATHHKFVLKGSADIPAFETSLSASEFDLAYMNPYHYVVNRDYLPVVRDHGRKLYGLLVVKKGGGINSIQDLQGKTLNFPAPNALGASLMIRAELHEKFGVQFTPKYVKTHSSGYLNTALGFSAAAGGVQKTFNQQPENIRDKLLVLHKTQPVTPHPLTVHKRVPNDVYLSIQQALLALTNTEHGKALLKAIPMKQAGPATPEDYNDVAELNLDKFYVRSN